MENEFEIDIQQSLHGYSQGHSMLASSCELSLLEKRVLLQMSDLSGPLLGSEFEPYVTAYPIENSRYYVLSKTWQATEMQRPGCVWTHSLLIDITSLGRIYHLDRLIDLFKRPSGDFSLYNRSVKFTYPNSTLAPALPPGDDYVFWQLFYKLYFASSKPILVEGYFPKMEIALLRIWQFQWPRLRRSFSFCTGGLAIRKIINISFDVQALQGSNSRTAKTDYEYLRFQEANELPEALPRSLQDYVGKVALRNNDDEGFVQFIYRYGSDVEGYRQNFSKLLFAFEFKNVQLVDCDINSVIQFFHVTFPNRDEAKLLKRDFVNYKLDISSTNRYEFLKLVLTDSRAKCLLGIKWRFDKLFSDVITSNEHTLSELEYLFEDINLDLIHNEFENVLTNIPLEFWYAKDWVTTALIKKILSINLEIIYNGVIWEANLDVQKKWLASLSESQVDWSKFLLLFYSTSNKLADDYLFELFGGRIVIPTMHLIEENVLKQIPFAWIKYLSDNFESLLHIVSTGGYPIQLTKFLIGSVPVDSFRLREIPSPLLYQLLRLSKEESADYIHIAVYFLTAALINNVSNPSEVIEMNFESVHDFYAVNQEDEESWTLLKRHVQIYPPDGDYQFSFFWMKGSNRISAPKEKTEELRRMLVSSIIKYNWDGGLIAKAIASIETVLKTLDYCFDLYRSKYVLQQLATFLMEAQNNRSSTILSYISKNGY